MANTVTERDLIDAISSAVAHQVSSYLEQDHITSNIHEVVMGTLQIDDLPLAGVPDIALERFIKLITIATMDYIRSDIHKVVTNYIADEKNQ